METPAILMLLFFGGVALALLWLLIYGLVNLARKTWNWVDDNEKPVKINPIQAWIMRRLGYVPASEINRYTCYRWMTPDEKNRSDGEVSIFMPMLILALAPSVIFTGLWLYPLTLTGATLCLVAFLARFARRHKKLFDKHLKDPEAHK